MVTKIINPANSSNAAIYNNNGSSLRTVNYMNKENENTEKGVFFNHIDEGIDHKYVANSIDLNGANLKKNDPKFDSIILAPSSKELDFIGSDNQKLVEYARSAMHNYALNFDNVNSKKDVKPVTLIDHGKANYKFDEENKLSYYIRYSDQSGKERIMWGVDLEGAISEKQFDKGDKIHIDHMGMKDVTVDVKIKGEDGVWRIEAKTVQRNEWRVLSDEDRKLLPETVEINKKKLPELVWFAAIHSTREYEIKDERISNRVSDLKKQGYSKLEILNETKKDLFLLKYKPSARDIEHFYDNGPIKKGDLKPGDNRHIHIIVSRKDKDGKTTLSSANRHRFNRVAYFQRNIKSFEDQFGYVYKPNSLEEKRLRMYMLRIEQMNEKYKFAEGYLDKERIKNLYLSSDDKVKFNKNFWRLENNFKNGIAVDDPEKFLEYASTKYSKSISESYTLDEMFSSMKSVGGALDDRGDFDTNSTNLKRRKLIRQRNNRER